jgi:hypothetical protein
MLLNPYASPPSPLPFGHLWLDRFSNGIVATIVLYSMILAVSYVLDSHSRLAYQQTETAKLNEQLSRAQLDALRRQIEPHFLFNTLNAIAGLVREKRNDDAVTMIAGLSDFLRRLSKTRPASKPLWERKWSLHRNILTSRRFALWSAFSSVSMFPPTSCLPGFRLLSCNSW